MEDEEAAELPPGVLTTTWTVPATSGAGVTAREVELVTDTLAAAADPKDTAEAAVKPVPVTVTALPPTTGPAPGVTALTVGTGS